MRALLEPAVERYRTGGDPNTGPFGSFSIPGPLGDRLTVVVSDGRDWVQTGLPMPPWEHVSVSLPKRCPAWREMDFVKRIFFLEREWAMQLHAPPSLHISVHPNCLHLWAPKQNSAIPVPPRECV